MIIYNFFRYLYLHIKYKRILNKVYKDENLLKNLSELFGHEFKQDWMGRVYTVVNPYIINGKFNNESHIFEKDDNGLNNKEYIEQYMLQKLAVVSRFITVNNLFDLLTYDIKKLDEYGNYLFVMKPITYDDCIKWSKLFSILIGVLTFVGILTILFINIKMF